MGGLAAGSGRQDRGRVGDRARLANVPIKTAEARAISAANSPRRSARWMMMPTDDLDALPCPPRVGRRVRAANGRVLRNLATTLSPSEGKAPSDGDRQPSMCRAGAAARGLKPLLARGARRRALRHLVRATVRRGASEGGGRRRRQSGGRRGAARRSGLCRKASQQCGFGRARAGDEAEGVDSSKLARAASKSETLARTDSALRQSRRHGAARGVVETLACRVGAGSSGGAGRPEGERLDPARRLHASIPHGGEPIEIYRSARGGGRCGPVLLLDAPAPCRNKCNLPALCGAASAAGERRISVPPRPGESACAARAGKGSAVERLHC